MEKRKAITMLIARYRADVVALKQREEELLRQIEIIGNLIPTATISYMSRSIRAGQMLLPHQEVEEAKERLEYLKHALTELQQSFGMVRKEAEIMNKRIVELETKFIETNYQYTNDMRNSENLNVWNEPYVKEDIRTESLKERVKNKSSGLQQRSAKVKIQEESLKPEVIKEQRENFDFEQSKYTYEPKQHSDKTENNTTLISDDPKSHGNLQKTVDVTREKNYKNVKTGGLKDKGDTFEQLKQSQRIKLNETSSKGKLQHEVKIIDTTLSETQHSDKAIDNSILKRNDKAEQSDKIGYVIRKSNEKPQCAEIIDNAIQKSNDKAKQSDKIDSVIPKSNEKPQGVEIIDNVIPKSNGKDESLDKIDNEKVHCSNTLIGHVIPKLEDDQHAEQIGLMTHHDIDDYNSKKIANTIAKSEDVNQCSVKPTLSSDDVYVRILQEITDGNNDNEKDFNHPVLEDKISTFAEMLKITDSEFGNNPNETGNTCSKSGDPSNQRFSPQISNVTSDKIREAINKDNIIYQSVKFDEIQEPVGSSINQRPDETDFTISPPDKIISSVIPNTDNNVHNELLNMLGRPSSIPIPEEQEFKIPLQATDENGKFVENYDELLDVSLKFEELLKSENTNWKEVYEKLSIQINELNGHLINSSQKINLYNEYVKHLEEKISILENELKVKIEMLEHRKSKHVRKSGAKIKQDMNKTLTTELSLLGEGEGVTPAYMQLAHWRFALKLPEYQGDKELKEKLMNGIKQGNMAPYYKEVCADLGWKFDSKLYDEMSAANVKRLEELEKDHENNVMDEEDQSQLCGVWQSKLDYLCSIGDRENASALANSKVDDKTVPKSHRIDAVFSLFRISFFHGCNIKGMSTAIEKATELIEGISGGDWSARNKLKAYEGVWSLAIRDFTRAAHLFVDVVPTFESYELADFGTIIRYTVLSCMIALPRCDLRKKLMLHGVMAQALHSQYQDLREYFVSLYDGRYSDFLVCLARIEVEMKRDPLLHPHYRHYVQEMRLRAYKQILQAYRSLSLDYMAQSFGVTSEFIEREVARFAAAGRLQCKIDSVAGTVITSAHLDDSVRSKEGPEASLDRNILYQTTVKRGDILLNRLKKLARVMDF